MSRHVPIAKPASAAAPSAVESLSAATSIRRPRIRPGTASGGFAAAPPSARSTPTAIGSTSSTSATWWAIASSAARARCARVDPPVRPEINPRASGAHCGEPRPVSAGTKKTPSVVRPGRRATRRIRRGRDDAEPVAQPLERGATHEHRALGGELSGALPGATAAAVFRTPGATPVARSPRLTSTKVPVPYVAFASPGRKQAWPKNAACWSPAIPVTGASHRAAMPRRRRPTRRRPTEEWKARRRRGREARRPTGLKRDRRASSATRWSRR